MRKKLALFLALILSIGALGGCANKDSASPETTNQDIKTDYRSEQRGLAFSLPKEWTTRKNVNLIPVTFVKPDSEIYAKVEYDFTPDDNMDELNNPDSQIPVEELMIPVFSILVVKEENIESQSVKDEMALFQSCEELPQQENYHFYYLTDYIGSTPRFSENSSKTFETLKSELPIFRKTIETFVPDEAPRQAQVEENMDYLNFMSTTLEGDSITSTVFYDYDLTVVNFWASYCYPDINELDTLEAFYKQLKEKYTNVNFIQVVIDMPDEEKEQTVKKAYEEAGVTFTSIVPDQNMSAWIIDNLNGLPTTVFVDNTGKPLETKIEGVKDLDYYIETMESMLKSAKAKE